MNSLEAEAELLKMRSTIKMVRINPGKCLIVGRRTYVGRVVTTARTAEVMVNTGQAQYVTWPPSEKVPSIWINEMKKI